MQVDQLIMRIMRRACIAHPEHMDAFLPLYEEAQAALSKGFERFFAERARRGVPALGPEGEKLRQSCLRKGRGMAH